MAPMGNIRDFFKPVPRTLSDVTATVSVSKDELPRPLSRPPSSSSFMNETPVRNETSLPSSSQRVIRSSDDEASDSDGSLAELNDMLQFRNAPKNTGSSSNGLKASTNLRTRGRGRRPPISNSPLIAKPKYQFDMKKIVKQAEMYRSAEASAVSLQVLLDETAEAGPVSLSTMSGAAHTGILESVVVEQEGASLEKVLQAIKRTEATQAEKRCYVFEPNDTLSRPTAMPMPKVRGLEGWKQGLINPIQREHIVLSDFAKDMIVLGDVLPDKLFLWILDEMCLESQDDLREAYSRILMVSKSQIHKLISQETVMNMFRRLGVKEIGVDTNQKLNLSSSENGQYGDREWSNVRATVTLFNKISENLSSVTCTYVICLLVRLCVDTTVLENIGLLSAVQKTMEHVSKRVNSRFWEKSCREICESTFHAVDQATLRFHVLRCMPQTTPRIHEIRRRLALAFFFEDAKYLKSAPHLVIDLWEMIKRLDEPQFQINRETDYQQLAALISILDIAIDNGQSAQMNMSDIEEERFNAEVDTLAARIRNIWSSINDAGASFMSRVDAKEVMDCLRHRLLYAIRTKPVPKKSIFDPLPDDREEKVKQTKFMNKYFIKSDPDQDYQ